MRFGKCWNLAIFTRETSLTHFRLRFLNVWINSVDYPLDSVSHEAKVTLHGSRHSALIDQRQLATRILSDSASCLGDFVTCSTHNESFVLRRLLQTTLQSVCNSCFSFLFFVRAIPAVSFVSACQRSLAFSIAVAISICWCKGRVRLVTRILYHNIFPSNSLRKNRDGWHSTSYTTKKASFSVDGKTRLWFKIRFRLKTDGFGCFSIGAIWSFPTIEAVSHTQWSNPYNTPSGCRPYIWPAFSPQAYSLYYQKFIPCTSTIIVNYFEGLTFCSLMLAVIDNRKQSVASWYDHNRKA